MRALSTQLASLASRACPYSQTGKGVRGDRQEAGADLRAPAGRPFAEGGSGQCGSVSKRVDSRPGLWPVSRTRPRRSGAGGLAKWITHPRQPVVRPRDGQPRLALPLWARVRQRVPTTLASMAASPPIPSCLTGLALEFHRERLELEAPAQTDHALGDLSVSRPPSTPRLPSWMADNRLLWRFTPKRLEGEAVRDAVLAVSGRLNLTMGGA